MNERPDSDTLIRSMPMALTLGGSSLLYILIQRSAATAVTLVGTALTTLLMLP